jgi:putative hydrolase of the HAD superfamily
MSGGRPSAVIFDFNGVLTRPPASVTLRRLRALAELEEDVLVDGYWRHRPAYDRGTLDAAEYWSLVGRGGGRTYTDSRVDELVWADAETWGRPNPAVVCLFLSLARRGIRSAILCNTRATSGSSSRAGTSG